MWDSMTWRNPPQSSHQAGGALTITTGDQTDYWHRTFYGFVHDNGHHLATPAPDAFTAELHVTAEYQAQYDQAGLMLWAGPAHWLKTGIEYVNGQTHLATVLTRDGSDWSQMPVDLPPEGLHLRLNRKGDAIWVQARLGGAWQMLRLGHFPQVSAQVGPMACSPSRAGLAVTFHRFALTPLLDTKAY